MRKCIWCNKTESSVSFDKVAHIVPRSLGGNLICSNVCDQCNHYFGTSQNGMPPIELVFKETFNISRARLLAAEENIGKNRALARFKSVYFDVDFKIGQLSVKPSFKLKPGFQAKLCTQFKKGLYKVFLEENERVNKNSLDDRYDFIREFARWGIGDLPVLYFPRKLPMLLIKKNEAREPQFLLDKQFDYHIRSYNFFEIEFLSHLFSFPTRRKHELFWDKYILESVKAKSKYHKPPVLLKYLNEIDLALSIFDQ